MSILWRLGSGTVSEVRDQLQEKTGYTSVLKIMQILEDKGYVRHEVEGRAYRYFPTVGTSAAGRTALGKIVDKIFHGSSELALVHLVQERKISADELDRMRRLLERIARDQQGQEK